MRRAEPLARDAFYVTASAFVKEENLWTNNDHKNAEYALRPKKKRRRAIVMHESHQPILSTGLLASAIAIHPRMKKHL
jgi:hypothetical protein